MEQKGPVWVIIFFLIIAFVLLNTLSVEEASTPLRAEARTTQGDLSDADIKAAHFPPESPPEGIIYQHFTMKAKGNDTTLIIDVNNAWLEQELIADDAITIYREQGRTWQPTPTNKTRTFAQSTSYFLTDAQDGTYLIIGTPGTREKQAKEGYSIKTQIAILIGIIIVLLFINYHRGSWLHKSKKESPDLQKLHAYINQSLLAGHEEKEIKERLLSAGWDEQHIDQGLRAARFF